MWRLNVRALLGACFLWSLGTSLEARCQGCHGRSDPVPYQGSCSPLTPIPTLDPNPEPFLLSFQAHICRAMLEAIAFQTGDVVGAMEKELQNLNHTLTLTVNLTLTLTLALILTPGPYRVRQNDSGYQ